LNLKYKHGRGFITCLGYKKFSLGVVFGSWLKVGKFLELFRVIGSS